MQPLSTVQTTLDLTILLVRAQKGDRSAWNMVYEAAGHRLREIAAALMHRERPGHLLSPTALVSESFLRVRRILAPFVCREHFFNLSAFMMRRVLVDHARRRRNPVDAESVALLLRNEPALDRATALAIAQLFGRLEKLDPKAAAAIRLRSVEGYTIKEASLALNRDPWDVRRDCDFGLKWMADRLG